MRMLGFFKKTKHKPPRKVKPAGLQNQNADILFYFPFFSPLSSEIQSLEPVFWLLIFKSEATSLAFSHLSLESPSGFLITVWKPAYVFLYHVSETIKRVWHFLLVHSLERNLSVPGCEIITFQAARDQSYSLWKHSVAFACTAIIIKKKS